MLQLCKAGIDYLSQEIIKSDYIRYTNSACSLIHDIGLRTKNH